MPREGDYEQNQVIPGTVYLVIRLLGSGGMGTVYEVEDTSIGNECEVRFSYVMKSRLLGMGFLVIVRWGRRIAGPAARPMPCLLPRDPHYNDRSATGVQANVQRT